MREGSTKPAASEQLRRRTDRFPYPAVPHQTAGSDLERLRHELQVYEIELELRTEELQCTLEELEAAKARYLDLYEHTPVGYLTLDEQGVIREANPCAAGMLGVALESLPGQTLSRFISPGDREGWQHQLRRRHKAGGSQESDLRLLHADGSLIGVQARSAPAPDSRGPFLLLTLTGADRGTQPGTEVRRDGTLLRCLIDSVDDLIQVKDMDGVYRACNRAYGSFVGLPEGELIGRTDFDLLPRDRAQTNWESDRQTLVSGEASRREEWVQYPDGGWGLLDSLRAPFRGPDGAQRGVVGISRDVTERARIEKALAASEEQFRTLCDAAPIGILRYDAAGGNVYCNPRWREITGIPASEEMVKGWFGKIHPDDVEEFRALWLDAMAKGRSASHEHRQLTPQGNVIWVRVLLSSITSGEGAVVSHVVTLEDVTALQLAREGLAKKEKLESLGLLAGGIAHDFNNILLAIFGNISLARFHPDDPEVVAKRLGDAESAIDRATRLTKQLLTFARGGEPVKESVDLGELLQDAARELLQESPVDCRFSLEGNLWPVEADPGQLAQVIRHLVQNALQAMPEGGSLSVAAENASSRPGGGRFVKVTVSDTGTGIAQGNLARIFDPYFTTKPQASGLGLATCYSVITKHGGKIRAASTEGSGSSFSFSLPASAPRDNPVPPPPAAMLRGSGRVLVMDDDEHIREVAQGILELLGYTAEVTGNGAEAVELYRTRREQGTPFCAAILDLTVPGGMGGKETVDRLLEIDPGVKAVVSSGYSDDPVMANYREHGFGAVLSKPYRPQEISRVLGELILRSPAGG